MAELVKDISVQGYDNLIGGTDVPLLTKVVTIASGANLKRGTVLGKVTASGKYVAVDSGKTDGSQNAECVLVHNVDASSADQNAVVYISGVFNKNELIFGGSDTAAKHEDRLRTLNIILTDLK